MGFPSKVYSLPEASETRFLLGSFGKADRAWLLPEVLERMRYWWVNQNQTHRQELEGGYLWSPKRNANEGRNPFYEFVGEVAPGDVVFSVCRHQDYCDRNRRFLCYENPNA